MERDAPGTDMKLSFREEIILAAGLFQGEGCFTHMYGNTGHRPPAERYVYFRVSLAMTDREAVERFYKAVGCGKFYGPRTYRGQIQAVWTWFATTFEEVQAVVVMLWPFLGTSKRQKALALLSGDPRRLRTHSQACTAAWRFRRKAG